MTQTALDQYAMEIGLGKTTSKMNEQEKTALRYRFVVDKLQKASGDFARTQGSWANQTKILSLQWESFQATIGEGLIQVFTPMVQWINDDVMPALQNVADWFANAVTPDTVDDLTESFGELGDSMGEAATKADGTVASQEDIKAAIEQTTNSVEKLKQGYEEAKEEAEKSIDSQIGLLTELETESETSAIEILKTWKDQEKALTEYAENLLKASKLGIDEGLVKTLADGSEQSMQILDEIVDNAFVFGNAFNDQFKRTEKAKDTLSVIMADINSDTSEKLTEMSDTVVDEWGEMADVVGESVREMQEHINSLSGATFDITVNKKWSGFGTSSSTPTTYSGYGLDTASIPALAQGAVIPPNAPFMAVLGDQTNGRNLEGPEEVFREIVRDELDASSSGETADLLRQLIAAVQGISVGDDVIGQAAIRYNRKMNTARGVW